MEGLMESTLMGEEPVSPMGQYCSSAALSLTILAMFETEIPIDDCVVLPTLQDVFLPLHTRFSSVMVKDMHGVQKWKRVNVKLNDHVHIPLFPKGLESYDSCFQDYLSKIALDPLPQHRPLWEMHLVKYATKTAAGVIVIKLHHSLGDGFSLMGVLFSCFRRADNPSLPPTFPSQQERRHDHKTRFYRSALRIFSVCSNTVQDFCYSLLKSNFLKDGRSPIRSGDAGVEFRPVTISMVNFSLSDINEIKDKLKGTINDVVTGIVFYGIHLYMQAAGNWKNKPAQVTGLMMFNTRAIKTYKTIQEMTRPKSKAPWGNHFTFLHVPISRCGDVKEVDPLDFIRKAKHIIKIKMNSLALYLTGGLLEIMRKLKGPEATARYIHSTFTNASFGMSNVIGPLDQVQIAGHPIMGIYFSVVGAPQDLSITMISYMGKMRVVLAAEKDFINSELLVSCMEKSFGRMYESAVGDKYRREEKFKVS